MSRTVKFRGGPLANTYKSIETFGGRFTVTQAVPQWHNLLGVDHDNNPLDGPAYRTKVGHYQQSNVQTRRGVPVFQWMGYEGEVIAR